MASFTVGIVFKFYKKEDCSKMDKSGNIYEGGIMRRAIRALYRARREDGRPLGRLLGDSVKESMTSLLMIGGFIMLFSVVVKMFTVFGVFRVLTPFVAGVLGVFKIDPHMVHAIFYGILEIDLGTMAASQAVAPLLDKVVIASWIIAWSGLCVHGQVASVIHDTDIRMGPYMAARFLHGLFAAGFTYFLIIALAPVYAPLVRHQVFSKSFNPIDRLVFSGGQLLLILGILLICSILLYYNRRYRIVFTKNGKKEV
jgi:sporulation integral membrane protein YlbJ